LDGPLKEQPSCLGLISFDEHNAALRARLLLLEYDPLERLTGSVKKGRFRNTGRTVPDLRYPLPRETVRFTPSHDRGTTTADEQDKKLIDYVKHKVFDIVEAHPDFRRELAKRLNEVDDARGLSNNLMDKGFVPVWELVARNINRFKPFFKELKRVLFLLALGSTKGQVVAEIREKLSAKERVNIFPFQARHALMVELILKAAIESEMELSKVIKDGRSSVALNRSVDLLEECGLDHDKMRKKALSHLSDKFPEFDRNASEIEQISCLEQRLLAFATSSRPYFVVHRNRESLSIPYLLEFKLPEKGQIPREDEVVSIGEEFLFQLINIILEEIEKLSK
jgi:hypothetical protein